MALPPTVGIEGALNRWDEMMYGHIVQSNIIHGVGAFLPWHRLYMRAHEIILQTECNYTGAQPYWDELSDTETGTLEECSILDADTGFGTGDLDDDGCVANGPFVNLTMHINQTSNYADYCLTRDLNENGFTWANSTYLDECMATESYEEAWYVCPTPRSDLIPSISSITNPSRPPTTGNASSPPRTPPATEPSAAPCSTSSPRPAIPCSSCTILIWTEFGGSGSR